jgi:hypothetical protein
MPQLQAAAVADSLVTITSTGHHAIMQGSLLVMSTYCLILSSSPCCLLFAARYSSSIL